MSSKRLIFGAGVILIIIAGLAVQSLSSNYANPVSLQSTATSTQELIDEAPEPEINTSDQDIIAVVSVIKRPRSNHLPLASGDSIASWDYKGAYSDNTALQTRARDEIAQLTKLLETATSSEMILSVGIANQYELLGNGKLQYEYLERAIQADSATGLPWHNIGVLMEKLRAFNTAKVAFEKATLIQPQFAVY
ncbi:MAG: hypothetical protein AAB883_02320, partial [Patescibacteria group bacterium]